VIGPLRNIIFDVSQEVIMTRTLSPGKIRRSATFAAGFALATILAVGTLSGPAGADDYHHDNGHRRDRDHHGRGWDHHYSAPPVVYATPYYEPPVVYREPRVGVYLPGLNINLR
jgi:hypothetical protein